MALCQSLLTWLKTIDEISAPHSSAQEASDGVAVAQALHQIAPEWFTSTWLSKIKSVASDNWRLKVSNLKKIVEGIVDYYQESCNQLLPDNVKPDVNRIAEHSDPGELGKLLQLVLGCAVNCDKKQDYITAIMAMELDVQQTIMQSIQALEGNVGSAGVSLNPIVDHPDGPQLSSVMLELEQAIEAREELARRFHELDLQVGLLQEEKSSIFQENRRLKDRLRQMEAEESSAGSGIQLQDLRKQLDLCKEELIVMETSRDEYRAKLEYQEKELQELRFKTYDLESKMSEAEQMKDEVDVLRETADKVGQYEGIIASYKKKLDEVGDMRRRMKLLEDKNSEVVELNLHLEDEVKKLGVLRNQLDNYKKQVAKLNVQLGEETQRANRKEAECSDAVEKMNIAHREKERLILERDALLENNEELKCLQLQAAPSNSHKSEGTISEELMSPDVKHRLMRLERENKLLKLNQRNPDEEYGVVLQGKLDEITRQNEVLKAENQRSAQRIQELQTEISELLEKTAEGSSNLKNQVSDLTLKLRQAQDEKNSLSSKSDEQDVTVEQLKSTVTSLQGQLKQKEQDLHSLEEAFKRKEQDLQSLEDGLKRKELEKQALEEKYKKCVEKAKEVINSLEPKRSNDVSELLTEKQQLIEELDRSREFRDLEERLMSSALYHLSVNRHREAVDQHLAALSSGQGQSFLARQRQPTNRRRMTAQGSLYNSK